MAKACVDSWMHSASPTNSKEIMAKSIHEQIKTVEAAIHVQHEKLKVLQALAANEVNPALIVPTATVTFDYGKGDTKRELTGTVTGVKQADPANPKSATMIRVAVGEGFDAQIVTIYTVNVKKVSAPAVEA